MADVWMTSGGSRLRAIENRGYTKRHNSLGAGTWKPRVFPNRRKSDRPKSLKVSQSFSGSKGYVDPFLRRAVVAPQIQTHEGSSNGQQSRTTGVVTASHVPNLHHNQQRHFVPGARIRNRNRVWSLEPPQGFPVDRRGAIGHKEPQTPLEPDFRLWSSPKFQGGRCVQPRPLSHDVPCRSFNLNTPIQTMYHPHHPLTEETWVREFDERGDMPLPLDYQENSFEAESGWGTPLNHREQASCTPPCFGRHGDDVKTSVSNYEGMILNSPKFKHVGGSSTPRTRGISRFQNDPCIVLASDYDARDAFDLFDDSSKRHSLQLQPQLGLPNKVGPFGTMLPIQGLLKHQSQPLQTGGVDLNMGFRGQSIGSESLFTKKKVPISDSIEPYQTLRQVAGDTLSSVWTARWPDPPYSNFQPELQRIFDDENSLRSPTVTMSIHSGNGHSTDKQYLRNQGFPCFQKDLSREHDKTEGKDSKWKIKSHSNQGALITRREPRESLKSVPACSSPFGSDETRQEYVDAIDAAPTGTIENSNREVNDVGNDTLASISERDEINHAFERHPTFDMPDWLCAYNGRIRVNLFNRLVESSPAVPQADQVIKNSCEKKNPVDDSFDQTRAPSKSAKTAQKSSLHSSSCRREKEKLDKNESQETQGTQASVSPKRTELLNLFKRTPVAVKNSREKKKPFDDSFNQNRAPSKSAKTQKSSVHSSSCRREKRKLDKEESQETQGTQPSVSPKRTELLNLFKRTSVAPDDEDKKLPSDLSLQKLQRKQQTKQIQKDGAKQFAKHKEQSMSCDDNSFESLSDTDLGGGLWD